MRCRCCNKPLSQREMMFVDKYTGVPDDFCYLCQAISRDPDNAEYYPQALFSDLPEDINDFNDPSDEDSLLD